MFYMIFWNISWSKTSHWNQWGNILWTRILKFFFWCLIRKKNVQRRHFFVGVSESDWLLEISLNNGRFLPRRFRSHQPPMIQWFSDSALIERMVDPWIFDPKMRWACPIELLKQLLKNWIWIVQEILKFELITKDHPWRNIIAVFTLAFSCCCRRGEKFDRKFRSTALTHCSSALEKRL